MCVENLGRDNVTMDTSHGACSFRRTFPLGDWDREAWVERGMK